MKKIAVIGASYLQEPLVRKAKEMGIYTLCFAWRDGAVPLDAKGVGDQKDSLSCMGRADAASRKNNRFRGV